MTLQQQARADAIASAKMHIREESDALTLCESKGWKFDARVARSELMLHKALLTRLLTQEGN